MVTIASKDGTRIDMTELGDGPAIIIVNGAFSTARDGDDLAGALADFGMRAITYDRRARGGSGHTPPVDPLREVEDLAAVLAASGGPASVIGHSSGAVLALFAAGHGLGFDHLFLSEPPFRFAEPGPAADLPDRLQHLVDNGQNAEAVTLFQREGVGLPEAMIEQIRQAPFFEALTRLAQSTVYDATLTRNVATPSPAMLAVTAPITILCGSYTWPILLTASEHLAEAIGHAELVKVPESINHRLDPAATTRIITERILL